MRYFLFTYKTEKSWGNALESYPCMPSNKKVKDEIKKGLGCKEVLITGIFEFKNEEDYNAFKAK
jgi:hypothetical protein